MTNGARSHELQWFVEAKLGIFIHWMAHSAVRSGDPITPGHVFDTPFERYRMLLDRFTLEAFDAERFVLRMQAMGARYIIPTSHHADGLCLWDTDTTEFKMTNGPAKLDVIDALAAACRKHGLKFGVYFPYCDQSHPLMQPLFATGRQDAAGWGCHCPLAPEALAMFHEHLQAQIRELCTRYGELAVLWWDGGPGDTAWAADMKRMVYDLQPGILQNSRWGRDLCRDRSPSAALDGDFFTPEMVSPSVPVLCDGCPVPFENPLTTTGNWLFDRTEDNYKRSRALVRSLLENVSKGGNLLLNLAPDEQGRLPREVDHALDEFSAWLQRNAEGVWGTVAGPRVDIPDATLTRRGNILYVHYYGTAPTLTLPGFGARLLEAHGVDGGHRIPLSAQGRESIVLDLSDSPHDDLATVFRLAFDGQPVKTVHPAPVPAAFFLNCARVSGTPHAEDWARAEHVSVSDTTGYNMLVWPLSPQELSFDVAALNDDRQLHIRVAVRQERLFAADAGPRARDAFADAAGINDGAETARGASVEIYIDAFPISSEVTADRRCFQIVISAEGKAQVAFAQAGAVPFSHGVVRTDDGYVAYCTLPFESMSKDADRPGLDYDLANFFSLPRKDVPLSPRAEPVRAGDVIGFNVSVNALKCVDGVRTKRKLWWKARSHSPFNDPHQWGRLRMAGPQACGRVREP